MPGKIWLVVKNTSSEWTGLKSTFPQIGDTKTQLCTSTLLQNGYGPNMTSYGSAKACDELADLAG